MPKNILNSTEFSKTRDLLNSKGSIDLIIDFGEHGFKGVLIETICLFVDTIKSTTTTRIISIPLNIEMEQKKKYIFSDELPYWVIFRDDGFDSVYEKMELGIFTVFRDRQITNRILKKSGDFRVLKSRNINDTGTEITDIKDYDAYVNEDDVKNFTVYKYLECDNIYMTPNMTYNSRIMKKPKNVLVNGSIALLKLNRENIEFTEEDALYISSSEFRKFLRVARNYQTRTLNVDNNSVHFFGKQR